MNNVSHRYTPIDILTDPKLPEKLWAEGERLFEKLDLRMVDDKGNIHISNNIGDVALKYQQEI